MLDLLGRILCAIVQLPEHIADWLVALFNLFLAGLAAAAEAVFDLLPNLPAVPQLPASAAEGVGWANWFLPVGALVQQLAVVIGLVVIFVGVAVVLRWIKAH